MPPEALASLLNDEESKALARLGSAPDRRLSPAAAAQFFGLYLQGYSTVEIARQNKSMGSEALGLIVRARVEYNWDLEREKHARDLMMAAKLGLEKATMEAIQFASDGMSVFHRLVGDRFRKYLQTGDATHLGDLKDMSFRTYQGFVEMLRELSRPPDPKKATAIAAIINTTGGTNPRVVDAEVTSDEMPLDSESAAKLLEAMSLEKIIVPAKHHEEP